MYKKIIIISIICLGLALAIKMCSNGEESSVGNSNYFVNYLGEDSFAVKEGSFKHINMINYCCSPYDNPTLSSCFGFNPSAPYLTSFVPEADNQAPIIYGLTDEDTGANALFRLSTNEAVVILGKTPPPMTYFSYVPYLYVRYSENSQEYVKIFATMTDAVNNLRVATSGSPNGEGSNSFDKDTMLIITPDENTNLRIRQAAIQAGYSESIINTLIMPSEIARLGLHEHSDEFMILNRMALPDNQSQMDSYLASPDIRVFRVTPDSTTSKPFATPDLTDQESGETENSLTESLAALRSAILEQYSDYSAEEYETDIWIPSGRECIQLEMECIGEDRDTVYLRMPGATSPNSVSGPVLFTLPDDPDDFLIVYGVNHVSTDKAIYHSISVYSNDKLNGIVTMTNVSFAGSASVLLPDDPNASFLYAIKVARQCGDNEITPCLEVPMGICPYHDSNEYGAPVDASLFLVARAYVDPITKVGPSTQEIIFDKTIHFRESIAFKLRKAILLHTK